MLQYPDTTRKISSTAHESGLRMKTKKKTLYTVIEGDNSETCA